LYRTFRREPLMSLIPQLVLLAECIVDKSLSAIRYSSLMRSIVSFELDDDCILSQGFDPDGLFFPQSIRLTHIRITLNYFRDCVRLLNELGSQLCSFTISVVYVRHDDKFDTISQIASVSNVS
jgi:hypothetical protein